MSVRVDSDSEQVGMTNLAGVVIELVTALNKLCCYPLMIGKVKTKTSNSGYIELINKTKKAQNKDAIRALINKSQLNTF